MAEAKKASKTKKDVVEEAAVKEKVVAEPAVDVTDKSTEPEAAAKAGKRSTKALKEVAEKEAKEERKASGAAEESKPKVSVKPARSKLERRGKGFRKSAEQIETGKLYGLADALGLAKTTSHVKFDATVELHVRLGVDPKHADQNIRDNVVLPAGTGKTVRVAVLDDGVFAELEKGAINFDVLVATPEQMPKLAKYARLLGPKGLMPNPKSGTVTTDVDKAVAEAKAGRVEYRVDSTGIVHIAVGKASFTPDQLKNNADAVMTSIKANKPQAVKGNYLKSIFVTTSMGPSIAVDPATV